MGLDITAHTKLRVARLMTEDEINTGEYPYETHARFYDNPHFPGRIGSIQPGTLYLSPEKNRLRFRAGSYSGYGEWRRQLAALVGIKDIRALWGDPEAAGPFAELINFADNEGTIGPEVSAKLAKDFAEHQAAADAHEDAWFRDRYAMWRRAFEMAADAGAVDFH